MKMTFIEYMKLTKIKDWPLWFLIGFFLSTLILYFYLDFSFAKPLSIITFIFLFCKLGDLYLKHKKRQRTFSLNAVSEECICDLSKQADGSIASIFQFKLMVKNLTKKSIGLIAARIIRPRCYKKNTSSVAIYVRSVNDNSYASAEFNYLIPADKILITIVTIVIKNKVTDKCNKKLKITLGIKDSNGNEQKIRIPVKVLDLTKNLVKKETRENIFMISDPVEKKIISVLQSELNRYEKCGRSVGGLGSIHVNYQGRDMKGVGGDFWITGSPKMQSISEKPDAAILKSENLDALIALYLGLKLEEKKQFIAFLLDRIGETTGYRKVSYFIVCFLWKVGHFKTALCKAKSKLKEGENESFGLSNVLMMLNGLLYYKHSDFTDEMLDEIDEFICEMTEYTFRIADKIAEIRTQRILTS